MNRKSENDKACKREDTISLEYYIANLLLMLQCARIWPAKSFSLFKILLSMGATIIFILANFLLLFSEIVALIMSNDLKLYANIIGSVGYHVLGLLKWSYCIRKNRKVFDIVKKLEKCHVLCQRVDNSEEGCRMYRNEMEHARKYSNFFICLWLFLGVYGVLHWCANPLLLEWIDQINSINDTLKKRNLPFIGWYPLNIDDIYNYVGLYFIQIIGGVGPAFGTICYDSFYITMLMVICAQFQYINIILMKINFDNVPEAIFVLENKLKNCVKYHMEIIRFLDMLQTFSGPTMFMQCIETLVVICLVSFEASTIKIAIDMESILKLWSLFEYFFSTALQLYVFCFFATQLEHLGLQIANSVYSCGWELVTFERNEQVDFEKQLKHYDVSQLIQIIMVRAQKPIILTGGPFYVFSLETFRAIMSLALSNSVILRTISDVDE